MSNIYVQEPDTTGKVVLITTHGEIEIELWTKETPKACRNFIQLIMEGYYDNTIFHRLIPGFMIQGGDPTETGLGGESIYGKNFIDEFHQRLKFSHRGIVAMANPGKANDNGSQFFITFDKCSWLNRKHTIFGKVVGNTMFNLLSMEHIDTDSQDKPINAPKILSGKILINPFDDIIQRNIKNKNIEEEKIVKNEVKIIEKTKNSKKDRNINLLSFQEEDHQNSENEIKKTDLKIKSSHDVLNDPFLKKELAIDKSKLEEDKEKRRETQQKKDQFKSKIHNLDSNNPNSNEETKDLISQLITKKRIVGLNNEQTLKLISENQENSELLRGLRKRRNKKTGKIELYWESDEQNIESESSDSDESSASEEYLNEDEKKIRDLQKSEYENLKLEFLKFKKNKLGTGNAEVTKKEGEEKKLLSALELQRMKYLNNKRMKLKENEIMEKLQKFKEKMQSENVINDNEHWMNAKLKFQIDSTRAYEHTNNKEKAKDFDEGLTVIDPRRYHNEANNEDNLNIDKVITIDNLIKMTEKK